MNKTKEKKIFIYIYIIKISNLSQTTLNNSTLLNSFIYLLLLFFFLDLFLRTLNGNIKRDRDR